MNIDMAQDDLSPLQGSARFVTFGEVMVRDTPADMWSASSAPVRCTYRWPAASTPWPWASAALACPRRSSPAYPDNPYGWQVRDVAREQELNVDHLVAGAQDGADQPLPVRTGAHAAPIDGLVPAHVLGRLQAGPGMVDWPAALRDCRLLHSSGIAGLANHSGYERNYCLEAL